MTITTVLSIYAMLAPSLKILTNLDMTASDVFFVSTSKFDFNVFMAM